MRRQGSQTIALVLHRRSDTSIRSRMLSSATTKSTMDTSAGLGMVDSGLNPEDEVMDEEVKLEDDMEPMAGSSSGTASQNLISTLEESSQSRHSISGARYGRGETRCGLHTLFGAPLPDKEATKLKQGGHVLSCSTPLRPKKKENTGSRERL
ncbi:uncharacterized protein ACDP82_004267 [Pangshura tecta]